MGRSRRGLTTSFVVCALALLVVRDSGAADPPPADAPPTDAQPTDARPTDAQHTDAPPADATAPPDATAPSAAEQRCNALADQFETQAAELRTRSRKDVVLFLEAIEIAEVADELVAEGDVELAASLFEEALALLEPGETVP